MKTNKEARQILIDKQAIRDSKMARVHGVVRR